MVAAEGSITVPHKNLEVVTAKVDDIELEKTALRKVLGTQSTTHANIDTELSKDLGETSDDFGIKKIK